MISIRHLGALTAMLVAVVGASAAESPPTGVASVHPAADAGARTAVGFSASTYGPCLSDTITATAPATNVAIKGHAVRLTCGSGAGAVAGGVCFDADLLRVSAGWSGGYLRLTGMVYDDANIPGPFTAGSAIFATPAIPGWSKDDSFADPRHEPYGPLPADWAHFTGYYQCGERVVFAYRVGAGSVLELPGLVGGGKAISRTFRVGAFPGSTMIVAELADGVGSAAGGAVQLAAGGRVVSAGLIGAPAGVALAVAGNRIQLTVPALASGLFTLVTGAMDAGALGAVLAETAASPDPATLTSGGPAHWPQAVETAGVRGAVGGAYVVDTLTVPEENPFGARMRLTGFDFFHDGRAAVCTWNGDVWVVSGIDAGLARLSWRRYAAGLHQPLGLKVVDDAVYVTTRDGIVRLRDLDGDGEADFYENFNGDVHTTPAFHEFAFDLQTDAAGDFYYAKAGPVRAGGRGWERIADHHGVMLKVARDGSRSEVYATGFRAPNGMSISPAGLITAGDNEGTWTPSSRINLVERGGFYGVPDLAHRAVVPTTYDQPLLWLPHGGVDNSSGGQVWVEGGRWGPLDGALLHLSYGTSSLFLIAWSREGAVAQGAAVRFPLAFNTGLMRARFNPADGQLYLCGMKGWQTNGSRDGGFQRVRYTGGAVAMPVGYAVRRNGIALTFAAPLDRVQAADPGNWSATAWNYLWTGNYGSPEMKPSSGDTAKGHDAVAISAISVAAAGRTVFLEIPALRPVMQMKISARIATADGAELSLDVYATVNAVGAQDGP
jgi:glucose/arabinose dehydrogenase